MASVVGDNPSNDSHVGNIIFHVMTSPACEKRGNDGEVEHKMVRVETIIINHTSRRRARARPDQIKVSGVQSGQESSKARLASRSGKRVWRRRHRRRGGSVMSSYTAYGTQEDDDNDTIEFVELPMFLSCLHEANIGDRILLTLNTTGATVRCQILKAIRPNDVDIKSDRYTIYLTVQKRYQSLRAVGMKKTVVRQTLGLHAAKKLYKFIKVSRLYIFGGIFPQFCYILSILTIHIKTVRDLIPLREGLYYITGVTALMSFLLLIPPMQVDTIRAILERFETYYLMYHGFSMNLMTYIIYQHDFKRVFATLISQTSCIVFALTHDTRHSAYGEIEVANFVTLFSCALSMFLWFYFTEDLEEPLNHDPLVTVHYGGSMIPIYPHTVLIGNTFTLVLFFSKSLFRSSNMMKNIRARLTLERFKPERHMRRVEYMNPKLKVNPYDTSIHRRKKGNKKKAQVEPNVEANLPIGQLAIGVDGNNRVRLKTFNRQCNVDPPPSTLFPMKELMEWGQSDKNSMEEPFLALSTFHESEQYQFTIAVDEMYASMCAINIKETFGPYLLGKSGFLKFLKFAKMTGLVNILAFTCAFVVTCSSYIVLDFERAKETWLYTPEFAYFSLCVLIVYSIISLMFVNRHILINLSLRQFDVWYQASLVLLSNLSLWYLLSGTLMRFWLAKVFMELLFVPFLDATFPAERLKRNLARPLLLAAFSIIYAIFSVGVLISGSSITTEQVPVITYFHIGSLHTIKVNFLGIFISTSTLTCIYLMRNTFYAVFYHNYLTGFTAPVVRNKVPGKQIYEKQYERQQMFAMETRPIEMLLRRK